MSQGRPRGGQNVFILRQSTQLFEAVTYRWRLIILQQIRTIGTVSDHCYTDFTPYFRKAIPLQLNTTTTINAAPPTTDSLWVTCRPVRTAWQYLNYFRCVHPPYVYKARFPLSIQTQSSQSLAMRALRKRKPQKNASAKCSNGQCWSNAQAIAFEWKPGLINFIRIRDAGCSKTRERAE